MAVRPAGCLYNQPPLTTFSKNRNTICKPSYRPRSALMPPVLVEVVQRNQTQSLFQLQTRQESFITTRSYTRQMAGRTPRRIYVRPRASRKLFGTALQGGLRTTSTSVTRSGSTRITKKQEAKEPAPKVPSLPLGPDRLLVAQRQKAKSRMLFNPWPSQRMSLSW